MVDVPLPFLDGDVLSEAAGGVYGVSLLAQILNPLQ
jgi:hypothetical protein